MLEPLYDSFFMRYLFAILLFTSCHVEAKEIFPQGCVPYALHDESVKLSAEKPIVVMLHNLSENKIWLTHLTQNASAQAGWSSQLNSGKWSALALDRHKKTFGLTCIESRPGHEQQISCRDILAVCKWPQSQFPEHQSGTFWAAENMNMLPLKAYIERRGFKLE